MDHAKIDEALLRFDREHPVWTRKFLAMAGEEGDPLSELERGGLISGDDESGYSLTENGALRFIALATEFCLDAKPGRSALCDMDRRRSLDALELETLLNRAFIGRWGIKEFRPLAVLPYWPAVDEEKLFTVGEDGVRWDYRKDPLAIRFFSLWPQREWGDPYASDLEDFRYWTHYENISRGTLSVDLLMLHRYDFHSFIAVKPLKSDIHDLMNSDRLFFNFASPNMPISCCLSQVAKLHLCLETQRRVFVPCGRFDRDSEEQDSVNWWFWVTRTREERDAFERKMAPYAHDLAHGAEPAEFWLLSLDDLSKRNTTAESFWDLFAEIATPLSR